MPAAAFPPDEAARLYALRACRILDSPPEAGFDALTRAAMDACATPAALISLVDERRQWFKSRVGLAADETPRDQSVCAHALHRPDEPLVVPDTTLDPRFADNPLVTGAPGIRFYAGVPLRSPTGHALGTLCVLDWVPRQLSPEQLERLRAAAQQVSLRLSLRMHAPAERRLALGFGLGFALLVAMSLFFVVAAARFFAWDQWVAHTNQVIRDIEHTLFIVQAAESSQRGYTASGQETYLPPYQEAVGELPGGLLTLRRAVADNPAQVHNFETFKSQIDDKLALMRQRFDERRTLGVAALEPRYLNGNGRRLMTAIIDTGNTMIDLENQLLRQRADARVARLHAAVGLLLGTSAVGSAMLLAGFLLTRCELRRRHASGSALALANLGLQSEVADRRRAQRRLAVQHDVARIADEHASLAQAAPDFLRAIGENLGWQVGELWCADPAARVMRCTHRWASAAGSSGETAQLARFADSSRERTFPKGEGLPGRTWLEKTARWELDLGNEHRFLRVTEAARAGLRRAFAFPLRADDGEECNAVMVFLGREPGAPDPELVAAMNTVAGQIAQCTERCRASAALRASQARFTAFMENAPAVAYIKDEEGRFVYGNHTLVERFNLRGKDWLGKTDFDLWPDAAPALRAHDLQVLDGGRAVEMKESLMIPGGSMSHWLSYKFPLRDEATGRTLLAGMSIDITTREHAQEAVEGSLREKETLLQEVHHRVKNNLQIIGSLLAMQARRTKSPAALAALGESAGRVRSIALGTRKIVWLDGPGAHRRRRLPAHAFAQPHGGVGRGTAAPRRAGVAGVRSGGGAPVGCLAGDCLRVDRQRGSDQQPQARFPRRARGPGDGGAEAMP